MVPVARPEEDPEVHLGVVGQHRRAVESLSRIELTGRRRVGLTRHRGEEALPGPARRRIGRYVELPELATGVADVHLVDVAVVVQVDRRRVLREAEAHVLAVIRRAVFVVLPEQRAVREVDGEERLPMGVVARRVVAAAEERDELVDAAELDLADRGLGPRLGHLRVGEAPQPQGIRGVCDVQGVVEGPTAPKTEDHDRLPGAADLDIRGDRARVHEELVVPPGVGHHLQIVEEVGRNEAPQLDAIAFAECVQHPVVGPGDQDLGPAGLAVLKAW